MADVGHEADAALVHADHRHAVAHQVARRGEHGAVAADHHGEIRLRADGGVIEPRRADLGGGVLFHQHLAAAFLEERGELGERRRDLGTAELADEGDAAEFSVHYRVECTMNRCSTSAPRSSSRL